MAGASRIWKFVKSNLPRVYDVDLLGLFLRFFTTSFELRAVDHSVFCHLSPRPAPTAPQSLSDTLRRYRCPSRRPARGCASNFHVQRDEHLSIDRPVCLFFRLACYQQLLLASTVIPRLLYFCLPHQNLTSTG